MTAIFWNFFVSCEFQAGRHILFLDLRMTAVTRDNHAAAALPL